MFANYIKLIFVISAYSPVALIFWIVSVWNIYLDDKYKVTFIESPEEIFNKLNWFVIFIILVIIAFFTIKKAEEKLTQNGINVKSIKSADLNMNTIVFSYFLPCTELFKKDSIVVYSWFVALLVIVLINLGTYSYNPVLKLFGYRYYEIATKGEVTYTMISRKKLINPNDIKSYVQIADYVILNVS